MDITPVFSDLLTRSSSAPLKAHPFDLSTLSSFLQEAYRINGHITELTRYLRSIRAPYLSLGTHRPAHHAAKSPGRHTHNNADTPMSDGERKRVETETKDLISGLSRAVQDLAGAADAEDEARQLIAQRTRQKKGFGMLGRWAAGGGIVEKSPEEQLEEERQTTLRKHREGVLWCLQKRLESVSKLQTDMVAVRLQRTKERNKSVLYKAGFDAGDQRLGIPGATMANGSMNGSAAAKAVEMEMEEKARGSNFNDLLSPDQVQMFEQEQEDMVKYYYNALQKIRGVETSLAEISSLNTELAVNLEIQSEGVTQLVSDSMMTTENIGQGNKQLKQASERKSTARMVFWATCGLCSTLVVWDLIF